MSFIKEYFDKAIERQFGIFKRNSIEALTAKQLSSVLAGVANRWEARPGYGGSILGSRVTYAALLEFQLDVMKAMKEERSEVIVSPQKFDKKIAEFERKLKEDVECGVVYGTILAF